MQVKDRVMGADITGIVACFFVVSVHFFSYIGFYDELVKNSRMFIMILMRSLFNTCVPLFLMLSGYLLYKKIICRRYYFGIVKIIGIYILSSFVCNIYRMLKGEMDRSLSGLLFGIRNFTAAPYSWYVEMYLGLFL